MLEEISYPEVVTNVTDVKAIHDASEVQAETITQDVTDMDSDLFIQTSTENGIAWREKILGITPLDTDTLEERRYRVLTLWYDSTPYTDWKLIRRIKYLCESTTDWQQIENDHALEVTDDAFYYLMDYETMTLTVKVALTNKKNFKAIQQFVEKLVPLHICLNVTLLYNKWSDFSALTWSSQSAKTWKQGKEDVL